MDTAFHKNAHSLLPPGFLTNTSTHFFFILPDLNKRFEQEPKQFLPHTVLKWSIKTSNCCSGPIMPPGTTTQSAQAINYTTNATLPNNSDYIIQSTKNAF